MENYSNQSKENQFKDWFCQQFNVDKDGKFKHQDVELLIYHINPIST